MGKYYCREGPPASNGGLDRIGIAENENSGKLAKQSSNALDHQQQFQQNGPKS